MRMKKREEITDQTRHQKLHEKTQIEKTAEPYANLLFIREITREKKRNLTTLCTMALIIA